MRGEHDPARARRPAPDSHTFRRALAVKSGGAAQPLLYRLPAKRALVSLVSGSLRRGPGSGLEADSRSRQLGYPPSKETEMRLVSLTCPAYLTSLRARRAAAPPQPTSVSRNAPSPLANLYSCKRWLPRPCASANPSTSRNPTSSPCRFRLELRASPLEAACPLPNQSVLTLSIGGNLGSPPSFDAEGRLRLSGIQQP